MSGPGYFDEDTAKKYSEALKLSLFYEHIHPFTVIHYLGDLSGKSILDVGCGNGHYCRRFKSEGAAKVVGIDWSKSMLDIARQKEEENPLGCQYLIGDAEHDEEVIGQFDIVVAAFVLIFADSFDRLKKFCTFLHKNLKPGGICLATIYNCLNDDYLKTDSLSKYGFRFTFLNVLPEGGYCLKWKILSNEKTAIYEQIQFCLPSEMYEKCFKEVGFKSFQFKKFVHDSELPDETWKEYKENPYVLVILADK